MTRPTLLSHKVLNIYVAYLIIYLVRVTELRKIYFSLSSLRQILTFFKKETFCFFSRKQNNETYLFAFAPH